MPSQSTITADEKLKVKSAIPKSSNKIISAVLARIYYAYPQPNKWSYAGLQGALVFTLDQSNNIYYFKMVDLDGTRGILWEHELYDNFEYNQDRQYFHSFEGDKCMIGFVFADESEAKTFHKKVSSNKDSKTKPRSEKKKKKTVAKGGKVDKSMISGPQQGSFIHVAHMGYDAQSGFTSKGVDPSWTQLLESLEGFGLTKETIANESEFIKTFTREFQESQRQAPKEPKKPKPPPPPSRRTHAINGSSSSSISPTAHAPPPPLPPARAQSVAPPPPTRPPARNITPEVSASLQNPTPPLAPPRRPAPQSNIPPPPPARPLSTNSGAPPPPPRPSTLSARPPPPRARPTPALESVPPPPPTRPTSTAPPPPPPPPPPTNGVHPPPPPPPPPTFGATPPPPPPPPPPPLPTSDGATPSVKAVLPPQPGRSDLLASIQGKGIHSLKKADPNASPARTNSVSADSISPTTAIAAGAVGGVATAAGGDLTSALAAALLERNKRLGDSDDDEDDDEDDWD